MSDDLSKMYADYQREQSVIEQGIAVEEQFREAEEHLKEGRSDQAFQIFQVLAGQGHAGAQNKLGYCYQNGRGVTQDHAKAVEWYGKAAQQGHVVSYVDIGYCYKDGEGVTQDYAAAAEWFRKAVKQGFSPAQWALDALKREGEFVGAERIPITPYAEPGSWDLADTIVEYLNENPFCIMANHGPITVGRTLDEALMLMESIEHTAKVSYLLRLYNK